MKIQDLKKKFKNKWVLVEVLKENKLNQVIDAKPIMEKDNRIDIYNEMAKIKSKKHLATIYTGDLPHKGMVYAF